MVKNITLTVLLVAMFASVAVAEEMKCSPLEDIENHWRHYLQSTEDEFRINERCHQNRQALRFLQREEDKEIAKSPDEEKFVYEHKKCVWEYLLLVDKLCQEKQRALGILHLDEARKAAKIKGKEGVADEQKRWARQYLGEAEVEEALPEVIILKPRNKVYEFKLKKGEQTASWLEGEDGTTSHIQFEGTDYKFEVHYKNGRVVRIWAGEKTPKKPNGPFKIIATDETIVLILVHDD
jgi:hypothetical protein